MKQKLDVCDSHDVVVPQVQWPGLHKAKKQVVV